MKKGDLFKKFKNSISKYSDLTTKNHLRNILKFQDPDTLKQNQVEYIFEYAMKNNINILPWFNKSEYKIQIERLEKPENGNFPTKIKDIEKLYDQTPTLAMINKSAGYDDIPSSDSNSSNCFTYDPDELFNNFKKSAEVNFHVLISGDISPCNSCDTNRFWFMEDDTDYSS